MGLRNIAFTIHVGGNDSPYDRNKVARQWGEKLDSLQAADPQGYVHWTQIYEGKGHWLDGEDAAALPWMAGYSRDPLPRQVVWKQDDVTHTRFYWLAVRAEDQKRGAEIRSSLSGQNIDVRATGVDRFIIHVHDRLLNLDEPVSVTAEGQEVFKGRVKRTIGMLAKTLTDRGDPALVFSGEIAVTLTK